MTISMYLASVPRITNALNNLSHLLDLAQQHVDAKKIDPATLTQFRLFPDMLPMSRQVQIASDTAKGVVARLAEVEIPAWDDKEVTLGDLQARLARTVEFVNSFKPAQIDGCEDRTVTIRMGGRETSFKGQPYLLHFALPNFFFHCTTAYDMLRHNGVGLGKGDFLGRD